MPKKISCPNCGANLKPDAYYCDYCGTFFERPVDELEKKQMERFEPKEETKKVVPLPQVQKVENEDEDLYKKDNFVSTEEIENSRLNSILISYNDIPKNSIAFALIAFWFITFFMFTGAVIQAPFFTIILIIILSSVFNKSQEQKTKLATLYHRGEYSKAYDILTVMYRQNKSIKIVKQKILLCYYRLNKYGEAKELIEFLNKYSQVEDVHISEVAKKLRVDYLPKQIYKI
ncbi:MAG: zinc ribbon domain-containing protein [Spirochaetales bacterium]